jgi:hypothetical protein
MPVLVEFLVEIKRLMSLADSYYSIFGINAVLGALESWV